MIICSCNILTEENIKNCLQDKQNRPSVGTILKELDCGDVCGTCATTVKKIIDEHYEVKDAI